MIICTVKMIQNVNIKQKKSPKGVLFRRFFRAIQRKYNTPHISGGVVNKDVGHTSSAERFCRHSVLVSLFFLLYLHCKLTFE